jgi:GTP-binding protein HflX
MQMDVEQKLRYAVVAAVQLPNVSDMEFEASLTELRELAKTLGFKVIHTFVQKRNSFDTTGYLGVGKRQEIRSFVHGEPAFDEAGEPLSFAADAALPDIEAVLVDHEISPSQARNLEIEAGCR